MYVSRLHKASVCAALESVVLPAPQLTQVLESTEYVPLSQARQGGRPVGEVKPGGHIAADNTFADM